MTGSPATPPKRSRPELVGLWFVGLVSAGVLMSLGATYGVVAYQFFNRWFSSPDGQSSGVMLVSFLVGVPVVIGLFTGFLSRRMRLANAGVTSGLSMLTIGLFVFAVGALFREGTICILMALPLLFGLVVLGMLLGWLLSAFEKGGPKLLGVAVVLPFAFGSAEQQIESVDAFPVVLRSVHIAASPEVVWRLINQPTGILPAELKDGVAYRIGVPYPIEARTLEPRIGGRRQLVWQRGVRFEERITAWEENRRIAWVYRFAPDSFPPGSLDDHIVIGGRYFGLEDTAYTLVPEAGGTRLEIKVTARVSTHFNWYAGLWAGYLIDDTAEAILNFYKHRAEVPG